MENPTLSVPPSCESLFATGQLNSRNDIRIIHGAGFSLVEMLVTVAVVGIVAALVLAAISQTKGRAKRIQCANNVRQLGLALQEFVGDNRAYPLGIFGTDQSHTWFDALEDQMHRNVWKSRYVRNTDFWTNGVWLCPSAERPSTLPKKYTTGDFFSYGYNMLGIGGQYGLGQLFGKIKNPPVNESSVICPSEMISIGDGFVGSHSNILDGNSWIGRVSAEGDFVTTARAYARHQGKANVVFCDGHVSSPKLQFLFEATSDDALVCWTRDHNPHREILPQ